MVPVICSRIISQGKGGSCIEELRSAGYQKKGYLLVYVDKSLEWEVAVQNAVTTKMKLTYYCSSHKNNLHWRKGTQ